MKNVIQKISKIRLNAAMKIAALKLTSTGSLKGFRICADGHDLVIESIAYKGDRANLKGVMGLMMHGNPSKMETFKSPITLEGDGESSLIIKGVKYSYGGNSFELEELEFSSLWEGIQFTMDLVGEGLEFIK